MTQVEAVVFPPSNAASEAAPKDKIRALIQHGVAEGCSDLHLRAGDHPFFRVDGDLYPDVSLKLTEDELMQYFRERLKPEQVERFLAENDLDFSDEEIGVCRMRINLFRQRERFSASIRLLSERIPSMKELYLPKACYSFTLLSKGLVLVTGPTGSGKTTTLAAMLDHINDFRRCHILTIEDPIEFIHTNKQAMISQREIKVDSRSFDASLRHSFRQDPDVIMLGEMRDQESMQMAITLAETGHLTFSSLHTSETAGTINRIVDSFPPHHQSQIRSQLSLSLEGIISQRLLPLKNRRGRVAAREALVCTRGVQNLIREGKVSQISSAIQTGADVGMIPLNFSLGHLYKRGLIEWDVAMSAAYDKTGFEAKYGPPPKE